ncbi:hypothetical protein [Flavimaricola marinus]|uniref:Uncharacterized protein n=1 Tax=Flavimaricola marinus TaxID=1819565 RepID=A0A238LHT3_9RHOB|nr:hypothetical protein [Flavimaricola marinus]SMY09103.1 hypothetical protein LOM8899_03265 [Flavimaricola marinus]
MADYISGTGRSRAPIYLGIGAVALVIILGLLSMGGGDETVPSTPLVDPEPIAGPETVAPTAPEPVAVPE